MEGLGSKSASVRSAERSRAARVKVKAEPKSHQELVQELSSFREQTVDYFVTVRDLGCTGLNPKSVVDTSSVSAEDLEEVWGKVSTYRTTNTKLHPETREELVSLYGKIYGTKDVTNNEFMLWVVKGFILECKGEDVDWATAAASTAREKAERCQRELGKSKLQDSGNTNGGNSQGSGGASGATQPVYSFCSKGGKPSTKLGNGRRTPSSALTKFSGGYSDERCPVSEVDLAAVKDVLQSEIHFLDTAQKKVLSLAEACKKEADRIIGLCYSMDDRKSAAKESEESVKVLESALLSVDAEICRSTQAVIALQGDKATNVGAEVLLQQLDVSKVERDRIGRKLEIAEFALEENSRRAVQGEEMYQNAEIELWKSNSDFKVLERQIAEMSRRTVAIYDQIHLMKSGAGVFLRPLPIPHIGTEWDDIHFELQPCSFCNGFFSAFDIIVASCRHMYHPFCIASVCSKQKTCVTCGEPFNLDWWRSFGFKDLKLQGTAVQQDPSNAKEDVKAVKLNSQDSGVQLTNGSQKQSDLGSSGSTFQEHKMDIEHQATTMPSVFEEPENGLEPRTIVEGEVNSPVKKSRLHKLCLKISSVLSSVVENLRSTGTPQCGSNTDTFPISSVVPVVIASALEDLREGNNSVDVEDQIPEDPPFVMAVSDQGGAVGKTPKYSFSIRRESGPLDEDTPSCKTISLSVVCPVVNSSIAGVISTKGPKRKGTPKQEEDGSRKTHSRRHDSKNKGEEAMESASNTLKGRITRSSVKPLH